MFWAVTRAGARVRGVAGATPRWSPFRLVDATAFSASRDSADLPDHAGPGKLDERSVGSDLKSAVRVGLAKVPHRTVIHEVGAVVGTELQIHGPVDPAGAGRAVEARNCGGIEKIAPRSAGRIEHRLRRVQEAEPIRPAVVIRAAVVVLPGEVQAVRRVLGRPRAPLVFTVFGHEQPASQRVVVWREPNAVLVPVAPREGLDRVLRVLRVQPRSQDGTVADPRPGRAIERPHGRSLALHAEGRIPACLDATPRVEHVVAELDILTRDILLVGATAVVTADHARVGRRPLRPVDMVVLESDLLCRVVSGRQAGDERGDPPGFGIDGHDARAVVVAARAQALVGVGREQPPALEASFERDIDRGTVWLEDTGTNRHRRRVGRLAEGTSDFPPALVEHQNVGREGIGGRRVCRLERYFVVADTGQAVPGLEHEDFKLLRAAAEGDSGWSVQPRDEGPHPEARGHDDVFVVSRTAWSVFTTTERVNDGGGCDEVRGDEE